MLTDEPNQQTVQSAAGVARVYVQVMTEQRYVLIFPSRKHRLLFFGRKWHKDSRNICSVAPPHLRGMCDPVAVPRAEIEGIKGGQ